MRRTLTTTVSSAPKPSSARRAVAVPRRAEAPGVDAARDQREAPQDLGVALGQQRAGELGQRGDRRRPGGCSGRSAAREQRAGSRRRPAGAGAAAVPEPSRREAFSPRLDPLERRRGVELVQDRDPVEPCAHGDRGPGVVGDDQVGAPGVATGPEAHAHHRDRARHHPPLARARGGAPPAGRAARPPGARRRRLRSVQTTTSWPAPGQPRRRLGGHALAAAEGVRVPQLGGHDDPHRSPSPRP